MSEEERARIHAELDTLLLELFLHQAAARRLRVSADAHHWFYLPCAYVPTVKGWNNSLTQ